MKTIFTKVIKTTGRFLGLHVLRLTADSASNYTATCVFSSTVFAIWNSHRRAAGVCAGGAWQEQSSPGDTEDCRVDRSTPGLKRPGQTCKKVAKTLKLMQYLRWLDAKTSHATAVWSKRFSFRISASHELRAAFVSSKSLCIFECIRWILKGA